MLARAPFVINGTVCGFAAALLVLWSPAGDRVVVAEEPPVCQPGAFRQAPNHAFGERESLSFVVRWGVLKAGKAVLAVEGVDPVQKRPAYHLSMDIRSAGITDTLHPYSDRTDAWLDRDSLSTVRYIKHVRESHYEVVETVDFDQACGRFQKHEHRIDKHTIEDRSGPIPANTLDTYGALFYLRTLPLALGGRYDLELFTGDKVLPVTAVVRRKARIKVPAGRFDCFLIEPVLREASAFAKLKQIQWWFTTDDRHLPVRIRMEVAVGHMVANLDRIEAQP